VYGIIILLHSKGGKIMSIDFNSLLTVDERKAVVTQRVQQLAVEAYQLTLNKKVLETQEEPNEKALTEIDNNLDLLGQMISVYHQELESLGETN
jgi:hypothetical protein